MKYLFFVAVFLPMLVLGGGSSGELIKNGSLKERDHSNLPVYWQKSIQLDGANGVVEGTIDGIRIKFINTERALQARIIQYLDVPSNQAYELSYEYRSELNPHLRADVLLTGSGPLYRTILQSPRNQWTKRMVRFFRPATEKGKLGIHVQNRSTVEIEYRNISLKKINMTAREVEKNTPKLLVQSVAPEDQLLISGNEKETLRFVINPLGADQSYHVEALLLDGSGNVLQRIASVNGGKINLDSSKVKEGINYLITNFFEKNSGALISYSRLEIERIPDSALRQTIDWSSHSAVKTRAGEAFFPIAMFGLHAEDYNGIKFLKKNGFNTIHCYDFETNPLLQDSGVKLLQYAEQMNMKVILGLPRKITEDSGKKSQLIGWVDAIKHHNSILCYYADEMYCVRKAPESCFKMLKDVLTQCDPQRQFIPYEPPNEKLGQYWDGIMWGANENMLKLAKIRIGAEKPFIHVFGQEWYKAPQSPSKKRIAYEFVMPVIDGARGIFFWWHPTVMWHNGEKEKLREHLFEGSRAISVCASDIVAPKREIPSYAKPITIGGAGKCLKIPAENYVWIFFGVAENGQAGQIQIPEELNSEFIYGSPNKTLQAGDVAIYKISQQKVF